MSKILMSLGDFEFEVSKTAHSRLRRESSYRWAKSDRIGAPPTYGYHGAGARELEIDGTVYTVLAGKKGLDVHNRLDQIASDGLPKSLIDQDGEVLGRFVISKISSQESHFTRDNLPQKITFQLRLERYEP